MNSTFSWCFPLHLEAQSARSGWGRRQHVCSCWWGSIGIQRTQAGNPGGWTSGQRQWRRGMRRYAGASIFLLSESQRKNGMGTQQLGVHVSPIRAPNRCALANQAASRWWWELVFVSMTMVILTSWLQCYYGRWPPGGHPRWWTHPWLPWFGLRVECRLIKSLL